MKRMRAQTIAMLILSTCFLPFQNCSGVDISASDLANKPSILDLGEGDTPPTPEPETPPYVPPYIPPVICDPFGGSGGNGSNGLLAKLSYLKPQYIDLGWNFNVLDYFDSADTRFKQYEGVISFANVSTPAREFSAGFQIGNGEYLEYENGTKMDEWFALKYESTFQLTTDQTSGTYIFGTLSDDGTILEAFINGQWKRLVDNQGIRPPRLKCQSTVQGIYMTPNTKLKIRLYYFQGPRMTIANTLLIKKLVPIENSSSFQTVYCPDDAGDDLYWDRSTGQATQSFNALINNGWSVPTTMNFLLDESAPECPMAAGP